MVFVLARQSRGADTSVTRFAGNGPGNGTILEHDACVRVSVCVHERTDDVVRGILCTCLRVAKNLMRHFMLANGELRLDVPFIVCSICWPM